MDFTEQGANNRPEQLQSGLAAPCGPVLALALVQIANSADRVALSVLIAPMKTELNLSDSQAGLLLGAAFATAYALAAIPLGRLADRSHRVRLLSACLAIWSLCTMAFGLAGGLVQLVLARVGVAAGEAGAYSTTQSLLADYVAAPRRAAALSIVQAGSMIGMVGGLTGAGYLGQVHGWRTAFLVFGAMGLPLALALTAWLREPARGGVDGTPIDLSRPTSALADLKTLLAKRTYVLCLIAMALAGMAISGSTAWLPSLLVRKFETTTAASGLIAALLVPAPMLAGTVIGGWMGDRLRARDARWTLWLPAACFLVSAPCYLIGVYTDALPLAMAAIAAPFVAAGLYNIPLLSIVLEISGPRARGLSASVIAFVSILVGQGLGPAFIGFASDLMMRLGEDRLALPHAMAAAAALLPLAAVMLLFAARRLADDLPRKASASA